MTIDFERIPKMTVAVGCAGALGAYLRWGGPEATGVLLGSCLSVFNFLWYKSITSAMSQRRSPYTPLLAARYLVAGVAVYVIFRLTGIPPAAVMAGLLANVAAIFLDILYQAIFKRQT